MPHLDVLSVSWSPDGRRIVFVAARADRRFSGRHVNEKVYVMRADGTGVRRLTENDAFVRSQAWSPDSSRIVFLKRRHGISSINVDGTGERSLTTDPTDFGPIWSPDGTKIAFTRTGRSDNPNVYVATSDGRSVRKIAQGVVRAWQPLSP